MSGSTLAIASAVRLLARTGLPPIRKSHFAVTDCFPSMNSCSQPLAFARYSLLWINGFARPFDSIVHLWPLLYAVQTSLGWPVVAAMSAYGP